MARLVKLLVVALVAFVPVVLLGGVMLLLGAPVVGTLGLLAIPVLAVLAVVGLPILLLLIVFGVIVGILGAVFGLAIAAIKLALFVALPVALVLYLAARLFGWRPRRQREYA